MLLDGEASVELAKVSTCVATSNVNGSSWHVASLGLGRAGGNEIRNETTQTEETAAESSLNAHPIIQRHWCQMEHKDSLCNGTRPAVC